MTQTPTSGKAWREAREVGYVKQLPSGMWARLRHVTPDQLLRMNGEIPNRISPLVVELVFQGADESKLNQITSGAKEGADPTDWATTTLDLINSICKIAFVEPRIVDDPQNDDEVAIEDIDLSDRGFVFQLCIQPAEVLRRFRTGQESDLEPLQNRKQVRAAAKQARKGKRPLGSVSV
jgi:hypothetical protein